VPRRCNEAASSLWAIPSPIIGSPYGKFFPQAFVNRGIGGRHARCSSDSGRRHRATAKVVVILAEPMTSRQHRSQNVEAIEDNLQSMAELAGPTTSRRPLLGDAICDYIRRRPAPSPKNRRAQRLDKDYAAKSKFVYLDYYSVMLDDKQMLKQEIRTTAAP